MHTNNQDPTNAAPDNKKAFFSTFLASLRLSRRTILLASLITISLIVIALLSFTRNTKIIGTKTYSYDQAKFDGIFITTPQDKQAISGTSPIRLNVGSADVEQVSFVIDGKWYASDGQHPFEWGWDTTKFTNGQHKVVAKARLAGDSHYDSGDQVSVIVTVNNQKAVSKPLASPKDDEGPTKPSLTQASQYFSLPKLAYIADISWIGSLDNDAISSYRISLNNRPIGSTTGNSYRLNVPASSGDYKIDIQAVDPSGNMSEAAEIEFFMKCNLFLCSAR